MTRAFLSNIFSIHHLYSRQKKPVIISNLVRNLPLPLTIVHMSDIKQSSSVSPPALCSVRYKKPVEKSILTRALWCLSSQNFHSYQICHSVPQVVTLATEIILEHGFGSLAVESLNVFRRIHQQCPKEFGLVVSMWYRGIIVLMNCKAAKFQRKAHSFAIMFESSIASNNYLVGYLCKELKERVIAAMLGYMEERGKDPILIMNIWSHFVNVLGNALHKHSSFLNEMLRVVEIVSVLYSVALEFSLVHVCMIV